MLFNSLTFALFLVPVYCLFLLVPGRLKIPLLLCASYLFYGFSSVRACGVLFFVSLVCYWGGHWLRAAEARPQRQSFRLFALVTLIVALLVYFKFVPFIVRHLHDFAMGGQAGRPNFLLLFVPVGISYYVFQGIGYLVDIYWGKAEADNLGNFLLFMAFFPKVMVGPIERGDRLLPQIEKLGAFRFDYDRFREGLLLFGWGLFKKLVVADHLARVVNEIYRYPGDEPGLPVAAGLVCFTFQLYSDFSGYTDMALGLGKIFGLELTQNFNRPFAATNIQDFWRRWHISFSSWMGDYVFLPLRMRLRSYGKAGLAAALLITFILVGVWHGTGWTFAIFGSIQGVYIVGSALTLTARNAFWKKRGQLDRAWLIVSRRLITFGMWTLSLVFFRAGTVPGAIIILKNLLVHVNIQTSLQTVVGNHELLFAAAAVVFMELGELYIRTPVTFERLLVRPTWQRWAVYNLLLLIILRGGVFTSAQRFIYQAF